MPGISAAARQSDAAPKPCPACKGERRLVNRMPHPVHPSSDSLIYECRGCGHRFTETVRRYANPAHEPWLRRA
jgi:DNA-directed RNA polymerase subunit M/transcription elongation factor TFIIS